MIVHPVPVHQIDEILLGVARQRRFAEVRIAREEGVGTGLMVGEVAATAAANEDLAARFLGVVQQQHGAPPVASLGRTHQAGRPGPDHHHIKLLHHHTPIKRKTAPAKGAVMAASRNRSGGFMAAAKENGPQGGRIVLVEH